MNIGDTVSSLFSSGIDAWKDIEVSKNYAANDPRPATRDANGNVIPEGQNGFGFLGSLTGSSAGRTIALAVVGGLIVWLIVRRLK
jgi:hypothetical protein